MAETTLQLGFVPKNRGEYQSTPVTRYYKDNVVQYNGSSYIADPVGWSESDPTATYVTVPPTDESGNLNAGWKVFASGNNTFTTGEKVDNVGIDYEPTAGSSNLVKSGGVYKKISKLDQEVNGEIYISEKTITSAGYQSYIAQNFASETKIKVILSGTAVFGTSAAWLYADAGLAQTQKLGGVYVQNNNEYEITLDSNITFIGLRIYTLTTPGSVKMTVIVTKGIVEDIESLEENLEELRDQVNLEVTEIKETIGSVENTVGILYPEFEIGNIGITNSGWSYSNSTTRVRLKKDTTVLLNKDDIIRVGEGIEIYVGWRENDIYGKQGWIVGPIDYHVTVTGEYVINSRLVPETEITNISQITDKLEIISLRSNKYLYESTTELKSNIILIGEYDNICKAVAHRGLRKTYPENTIIGFKAARRTGFRYCETDIYFTIDNVAVLSHDATINRCARNTDGTELAETITIGNVTYEQLLQYDFGIYKGSQFAGTKIPRLDDFLIMCHHIGLHPYLELKGGSEQQVKNIATIVRNCGMEGNVTYIGYNTNLAYIHSVSPLARLGVLSESITDTLIASAIALKNENEVFIDAPTFTDTDISLCSNAGVPLEVWGNTINGTIVTLTKEMIIDMPSYITGATTDGIDAGKIIFDANIN